MSKKEEIDKIMEEMEAKTPNPSSSQSTSSAFPVFQPETATNSSDKAHDEIDAKLNAAAAPQIQAIKKHSMSTLKARPGLVYPSIDTDQRYYDTSNEKTGIALIFNQKHFKKQATRLGTNKDESDLKEVLTKLGFQVRAFKDLRIAEIKDELYSVSKLNHSNNDCLLVVILTHGEQNGAIHAYDGEFKVQSLWENFIGNNCESLIGKPKLFFIQACRGSMTDPGILLKPKPRARSGSMSDSVDSMAFRDDHYVIPTLCDLLVMYSTAEGYFSFRNPEDGSWFIQALCAELRENPQEDLMTILTFVNRRVAFGKQSNIPHKPDVDAAKQMPNIVSMLTKTLYFRKKT